MLKLKNKKGVFGLTSVQTFFVIILGLGLLAYVIVVIMGILSTSNIIPQSTLSTTIINESTVLPVTEKGITLTGLNTYDGATGCAVTACANATGGAIPAGNFSASGCTVSSIATIPKYNNSIWKCTYNFNYNIPQVASANSILVNTSIGVTSFFGAINPVYAILAVLVIILVLIVLVRVVSSPSGSRQTQL